MPTLERTFIAGALAIAALLASAACGAQERDAAAAKPPSRAGPASLLAGTPVSSERLATYRGGTDVLNDMKLRGIVADNQAINVTTGSNVISDGAFAGAAGIPTVIQNSGNNVLIQSATIVNVQVK